VKICLRSEISPGQRATTAQREYVTSAVIFFELSRLLFTLFSEITIRLIFFNDNQSMDDFLQLPRRVAAAAATCVVETW